MKCFENCTNNIEAFLKKKNWKKLAPGMGFEPMRTRRSTGSQGPRVNHSAIPALFKCNEDSCLFLFFLSENSVKVIKL